MENPEEENMRLRKRCRKYEKELAEINTVDRWQIGRYLHDSLGQQIASAKIHLNMLKSNCTDDNTIEKINNLIELVEEMDSDVRDLSRGIIPKDIAENDIRQAFHDIKDQTEMLYKVNVDLEVNEIAEKVSSSRIIENLSLITQEAIKNAARHGNAEQIKVALLEHEDQLYLHVKDDGKGFDTEKKEGVGLDIMKNRAKEIGGNFRIRDAKEGEGFSTYITCNTPLENIH